jgi:prepilin-type N-terminal cleavage/methylation domain-containing protein
MRSAQRGFSLIELTMVIAIMTVIIMSFLMAVTSSKREAVVIGKRSESGEVTLIKPKTELISIENSVREHELNSAPDLGKTLSEMAAQPSIKPKTKVYEPGERQTTEAF